jgi:hypothetical protein
MFLKNRCRFQKKKEGFDIYFTSSNIKRSSNTLPAVSTGSSTLPPLARTLTKASA